VRLLLPAVDYAKKDYQLPLWAYSAVGDADGQYFAPAFEIDDNFRWHPDQFDDRALPSLDISQAFSWFDFVFTDHSFLLVKLSIDTGC